MIQTKNKIPLLGKGLVYAVISLLFLLCFSVATSPLTDYWGGDSAFFILVGQGMTKGLLPYRDFFDMKGPYLFLIEYLGQVIWYGRNGIFLIQWVNLFVCLCIISRIFEMACHGCRNSFLWELLGVFGCLFIASFTIEYGNVTEEYSLPWLLLSLYFCLKYIKESDTSGQYAHSVKVGFYYGFAFGVLALIRVTNAAFIGGAILTISVGLICKKEFRNLLYNGLAFILGCAAAFAPVCVYFACRGLLGEMLKQVFLFGVQYSGEVSFAEKLMTFRNNYLRCLLWMGLGLGPLVIYRVKKLRQWLLTISALGLLLVAVNMGNSYLHYFTLGIPNLVLGLAFAMEYGGKEDRGSNKGALLRRSACAVLIVAVLVIQLPFYTANLSICRERRNSRNTDDQITQIVQMIPQEQRSSVYVYGLRSCSNWYVQAGLFPAHRYCDWQAHYIELVPEIGNELENWLRDQGPAWVIIPEDLDITTARIGDALLDHYRVYGENASYIIYQRSPQER